MTISINEVNAEKARHHRFGRRRKGAPPLACEQNGSLDTRNPGDKNKLKDDGHWSSPKLEKKKKKKLRAPHRSRSENKEGGTDRNWGGRGLGGGVDGKDSAAETEARLEIEPNGSGHRRTPGGVRGLGEH